MFVMKVTKANGLPALGMSETMAESIESAKDVIDDAYYSRWEEIRKCLGTKRKWSDGNVTITITEEIVNGVKR